MRKQYIYKRFKYTPEQFTKLKNDLIEWNSEYYKNAKSIVSDQVFDAHLAILKGLEEKYPELQDSSSPTQKPGN